MNHKTKLLIFIIISGFVLISTISLFSTPEFSLWTGNKCSTCHISSQGGGMRNDFGWAFSKDASYFTPDELGMKSFYDITGTKTNSCLDGLLSYGFDFRMQLIRSHKTENAVRRFIPMQASAYLSSKIADWLLLEGQYNIAKKIFNGQQFWAASAIFKPLDSYPYLRVGFFQPSIGLKDCDMTSLDRRTAAPDGTESFIPPDYAEYGFELVYDDLEWMTMNAGMFGSNALSEVSLYGEQLSVVAVKDNPSFNYRVVLYPNWFFETFPDCFLGGSVFVNGKFILSSGYAGIAIYDDLHLYIKGTYSNIPFTRYTANYIAGMTYIPFKGVVLGLRYENGSTDLIFSADDIYKLPATQIVANAKLFLVPYLEIIPEYRFLECEEYRSTRWALQFHFYY